jgi:2Fe-2S ferredoxin
MAKVIYRHSDGTPDDTVDVPVGTSVMLGAVSNAISGIVAECGGSAMCATCHVYVEGGPSDKLPPMGSVENEMLESTAAERKANSRLSCQIKMTPELDGLTVRTPERQV